jgi:hypothetical protein
MTDIYELYFVFGQIMITHPSSTYFPVFALLEVSNLLMYFRFRQTF